MNTEKHDELWELLGLAKKAKVSPFFSRNVLRAIRDEKADRGSAFGWLRSHWQIALVGVSVLAVMAGLSINRVEQPDPLVALADQVSASPDYHVISHLDELLDSEQNSVWLEASAY